MNQRDLKQQIRSGKIKNLYIFCGNDYFLKRIYLERLAKSKDSIIEKTEAGDREELESVNLKAMSMSIFERKHKVIYCSVLFQPNKDLNLREPKNNILILDLQDCPFNHPNIVHFEKPTIQEIKEFLLFKTKNSGKRLEPKALDFLLEILRGKDTAFIENTLNSVLLFCWDKDNITLKDVKLSAFESPKFQMKDLFKILNAGKNDEITEKIGEILKQTPPSLLIYILSDNFCKIYATSSCDESCFSSFFKGYYSSYKQLYENYGKNRLKKILKDLYQLDKLIKSSKPDGIDIMIKAKLSQW